MICDRMGGEELACDSLSRHDQVSQVSGAHLRGVSLHSVPAASGGLGWYWLGPSTAGQLGCGVAYSACLWQYHMPSTPAAAPPTDAPLSMLSLSASASATPNRRDAERSTRENLRESTAAAQAGCA